MTSIWTKLEIAKAHQTLGDAIKAGDLTHEDAIQLIKASSPKLITKQPKGPNFLLGWLVGSLFS